jgi:hypothetical protein
MRQARPLYFILLFAAALGGCHRGGTAAVTQFPQWEFEHYQRVAVLPGRATTPQGASGAGLLTDRLTTLLTQNGAFKVLSRTELEQVFAEQDLSRLADAVDEGTALPEGKLEIAQALVATKITDYKLIAERTEQVLPVYARDRRGRMLLDRAGRPIRAGEQHVWTYRHGAEVEGSVRVIDAATGRILISHSARIAPKPKTAQNRPPKQSPEELATEAVRELAVECYKAIAPTQTKVKLKSDMLLVATEYFDGKYATPKRLSRELTDFLVVVHGLPEDCERNNFRVAIAEVDGRDNLFEQQFTWSGSAGTEGVSYRVPLETLTKTGTEKFELKLYSGRSPEPILRREFELEKLK